jgi:SAM-dependent methyltransferase
MRGRFEGLGHVVRFNWPQYVVALLAIVALVIVALGSSSWVRWCALAGIGFASYFVVSSLLATWWVYDRSELYRFEWMGELQLDAGAQVVCLSAGFDEISDELEGRWPLGRVHRFDFYDAERDTEASIVRARQASSTHTKTTAVDVGSLPLPDDSADLVVAFMSLHEIRSHRDRVRLLGEVRRILAPGACCVVVEHLRDPANVLVYGPGAWHFLKRRHWIESFEASGLSRIDERKITAFVSCFLTHSSIQTEVES